MCGQVHDSSCHGRPPHKCSCSGSRIERFMAPCLLLLLLEKPAHGYDLMERLKELGFDGENQDPGMVYRNLRRLEEEGMVRSE
ncbi:MAG: PadR family transcriptional regulator [Firmicutes bacterium]|nr:PadR family transcriptional regulator [Bacillota bacterium]